MAIKVFIKRKCPKDKERELFVVLKKSDAKSRNSQAIIR